jgi:IS30 family transposase
MGQIKDTTKDKKGKHLNFEERIKIEALYNLGLTPTCIGEQVGNRSRRTIERELKLGMYERESSYM